MLQREKKRRNSEKTREMEKGRRGKAHMMKKEENKKTMRASQLRIAIYSVYKFFSFFFLGYLILASLLTFPVLYIDTRILLYYCHSGNFDFEIFFQIANFCIFFNDTLMRQDLSSPRNNCLIKQLFLYIYILKKINVEWIIFSKPNYLLV